MPIITVKLQMPVRRTFRVEQVAGMFDVPLGQVQGPRSKVQGQGKASHPKLRHELTAEVPGLEEKWTIGAIVGPSGSGKTTLAKAAFGAIHKPRAWPRDRAIIDVLGDEGSGFGVQGSAKAGRGDTGRGRGGDGATERQRDGGRDGTWSVATIHSIKDLTRVLVAVGLGSPPTWLKPYHVLSGGEKFRADLVRAVLEGGTNLTQRRKGTEASNHESLCASAPLREPSLIVIDEFTSSLDRTVAKTASAALARLLRSQGTGNRGQETAKDGYTSDLSPVTCHLSPLRFVAVTCHRDILPWLSPDWVVELGVSGSGFQGSGLQSKTHGSAGASPSQRASPAQIPERHGGRSLQGRLIRGRPRKPSFSFRVERVPQALWTRFSGEHYLSGGLAASASCYGAFPASGGREPTEGSAGRPQGANAPRSPVAFCAVVAALGWKQSKRIQRLVVLPEFQGMGIGGKLLDMVAADQKAKGFRVTITASHPAVLEHCARSARWRYLEIKKLGSTPQVMDGREVASSVGRAVAAFEFVGRISEAGASR